MLKTNLIVNLINGKNNFTDLFVLSYFISNLAATPNVVFDFTARS